MKSYEIVKALRKKGLTWKQIGDPCKKKPRTVQNWASENHHGPAPASLELLKQLAVREEVL